jgi:hypothetical protein
MPLPPYPVLPAPYTWGANGPELVLVPTLRADVANAVNLFANPPLFAGSADTTQSITQLVVTPVTINNIISDLWVGFPATTTTNWYFPLPGWYVVEGDVPGGGTGGTGTQTAAIGYVSNGAAIAYANGGRVHIESTYNAHPSAMKLVLAVQTPSTDYAQLVTYQTTTAAQSTVSTLTKYPQLLCHWVAAPSGATGLPVPQNPAWPVPPAYITSAGYLNPAIRDTINFLAYPPFTEWSSGGTTQSVPSGTVTPVTILSSATVDNYNMFTSGTGTITVPVPGTYYFYGCVCFTEAGITTGLSRAAVLVVNSTNYGSPLNLWGNTEVPAVTSSTTNPGHNSVVRQRLRLNAGDTVQLAAFQTDSSSNARTIGTASNNISRLIGVWRTS